MVQSIWWYLWNRYHSEPYTGHAPTSKPRECYECRAIADLLERVSK